LVLIGLSNYNAMVEAIDALARGAISLPELAWKILPVTGLLIPALGLMGGIELLFRRMLPSFHAANKPWMVDPMWAAKHIRLNNRRLYWSVAVSWLLFAGIALPFAIATAKTPFMFICGAIGLVLLLMTRVFWLNRKWNTAELRMAEVPGVIGGAFSGVAILQQTFPEGVAFDVSLRCEQTKTYTPTHGSGGTSTNTETVWSATISIDKLLPADGPNRTIIPFGFAIPYDCEPTSVTNNTTKTITRWRFVVNQKDTVGFGGSVFTVPISVTPQSRADDYELDKEFFAKCEQEVDLGSVLTRVKLTRFRRWRTDGKLSAFLWSIPSRGHFSVAWF
jgi:hypothetical protein